MGGIMGKQKVCDGATLYRVCDMPERLRPREEVERSGVENVADDILLAIVLRSGVQGLNVIELARSMLRRYGSLSGIAKASAEELTSTPGIGPVKAQVLRATLELGSRLAREATDAEYVIRAPEDVARLLRPRARTLEQETFWVLLLDAKNRLKGQPLDVTQGILDASLVHPREVFREAVRAASAAIVVAHNHPSGDPTPSAEDVRITRQLVSAGRVVDIKVLDHVVVGRSSAERPQDFVSLRESGVVNFEEQRQP